MKMTVISLLMMFLTAGCNANAGDFDRQLSAGANDIKAEAEANTTLKAPVPPAVNKQPEFHDIRVCSYMFPQPGGDGIGIFAFDLDKDGKACRIPVSGGHAACAYRCDGSGSEAASTVTGETALLLRGQPANGTSLYHLLNLPADFAKLEKFRGKLLISGRPPADLTKPIGNNAAAHSISCKMERLAFEPAKPLQANAAWNAVEKTSSSCAYNPMAPGCPGYCSVPGNQMLPGCPMYCSSYPTSPECQDDSL